MRQMSIRRIKCRMKEKANLYLERRLKEKLMLLAKKSRRSLSQYVEDLIDQCPDPDPFPVVPLLGIIPGEISIPPKQEKDVEWIEVHPSAFKKKAPENFFALKVKGNSMKEAGIKNGDTILLEKRTAQSGDIIAALIEGECTLKRYLKEGTKHIRPSAQLK